MAWFALWPDLSILLTHPWQILSYSVLHGNFTHLLFNMFAVWMFGSRIEMVWGPRRTAITYLSAIVFGAIAQMLVGEILSSKLLVEICLISFHFVSRLTLIRYNYFNYTTK